HYGIVATFAGHLRYLQQNLIPWQILEQNTPWWRQAFDLRRQGKPNYLGTSIAPILVTRPSMPSVPGPPAGPPPRGAARANFKNDIESISESDSGTSTHGNENVATFGAPITGNTSVSGGSTSAKAPPPNIPYWPKSPEPLVLTAQARPPATWTWEARLGQPASGSGSGTSADVRQLQTVPEQSQAAQDIWYTGDWSDREDDARGLLDMANAANWGRDRDRSFVSILESPIAGRTPRRDWDM
ncbi:unnamed protein product, partial [Polarella glacialis]